MDRRIILFFYLFVRVCQPYTLNDTDTLRADLLDNYNSDTRGNMDQTRPTNLRVQFFFYNINEFDEVLGIFSVTGFFYFYWTDERMIWDPQRYNGTTKITFPATKIWTPTILLGNSNDESEIQSLGYDWLNVRFDANGTASWSPGAMFKSFCKPDVIEYPYDTQICSLNFIPWGHDPGEIRFTPLSQHVNMDLYMESGLWEIINTSVTTMEVPIEADTFQLLVLSFSLKRRALFYLMNMILPIAVMGGLNLFVFILPHESGERIGYSITLLLAICVYLTIASDNLPQSSFPSVSLLCAKLFFDMIISSFVLLFTILGLRCYHTDSAVRVPSCLVLLTKCVLCKCCITRERVEEPSVVEHEHEKERNNTSNRNQTDINKNERRVTWTDVGKASDVVFFCITFLAFTSSHLTYYLFLKFT
ncbi:hypothetical protein FSP39_006939 [Pinctada imbricata]|uniref:Uncharacterized protein n=1 Tax=Pinctada imbricata TaxID=66713 RepID=A0AA88YQ76_PINIB|nr:hypothetical protein FSP39_006939 [Pinctada imbricata]